MTKISKSKNGQHRITIPPSIITVFDLEAGVEYNWISVQGLPALRKRV
jgi:hypothetical protein